jgi:hypothetical protein
VNKSAPIVTPGIREWLIVVVIFLFIVPGNLLAYSQSAAHQLDAPVVHRLTNPSDALYDVRWVCLVNTETTCFAILAYVGMLFLWPLFFLRHHFFPSAFACASLTVAALLAARGVLATAILSNTPLQGAIYTQAAIGIPIAIALAIYVVRSRRALVTFSRHVLFYPAFPFFTRV